MYAWFIQGANASVSELNVDSPLITSYEIRYFTRDFIYKYSSATNRLLMYNGLPSTYDDATTDWIEPDYHGTENQGKTFSGIFMGKYDPLIPVNNTYNNVIIEFTMNYTVSAATLADLSSIVDSTIAEDAISVFEPSITPANIQYLSSFAYIQYMSVAQKVTQTIFTTVTDAFSDPRYPKISFNVAKSELAISEISLDPLKNVCYFYLNISYNEQKIMDTFQSVWGTDPVVDPIYFFQDMVFVIRKKGA